MKTVVIDGDRRALGEHPFGGDRQQFIRDFTNELFDPRALGLPGLSAQPVELHNRVFRPVARQHLDVFDGNEQLVVAMIENAEAIMRRAADLHRLQPVETADAMVDMHDEIAFRQSRRLREKLFAASASPGRPGQPFAENVLLGIDNHIVEPEPAVQIERGKRHGARRLQQNAAPILGGAGDRNAVL